MAKRRKGQIFEKESWCDCFDISCCGIKCNLCTPCSVVFKCLCLCKCFSACTCFKCCFKLSCCKKLGSCCDKIFCGLCTKCSVVCGPCFKCFKTLCKCRLCRCISRVCGGCAGCFCNCFNGIGICIVAIICGIGKTLKEIWNCLTCNGCVFCRKWNPCRRCY